MGADGGTATDTGIGGAGGNEAVGAAVVVGRGPSLFTNTKSAKSPSATVPIANVATRGTMLAGLAIWIGTGFV